MKDLAVLIPAHNNQSALLATLDGIDEPDNAFTVVIVDDGSISPIRVNQSDYWFPIAVVRQEEHKGIALALKAGLNFIVENGFRIMAHLDVSNINRPGRFQRQYRYLAINRSIQMVGSNARFFSEMEGRKTFTTHLPLEDRAIKRRIPFRRCFIQSTVMLRTPCIEEVATDSPNSPQIGDVVSKIAGRLPCANIDAPLVDCPVRGEGAGRNPGRQRLLSDLGYSWKHRQPLNPLWYAHMSKGIASLAVPFWLLNGMKNSLQFIRNPRSNVSEPETAPHLSLPSSSAR